MDASKRLVNLFYAGATILAWVVFSKIFSGVFATLNVRDAHLLGKQFTATTLLGALAAVATFIWAWKHARYRPLTQEVADELVKVTWPTWDETKTHTKVTIAVTIVLSAVLWVFDQVFGNLTNLILGG